MAKDEGIFMKSLQKNLSDMIANSLLLKYRSPSKKSNKIVGIASLTKCDFLVDFVEKNPRYLLGELEDIEDEFL